MSTRSWLSHFKEDTEAGCTGSTSKGFTITPIKYLMHNKNGKQVIKVW